MRTRTRPGRRGGRKPTTTEEKAVTGMQRLRATDDWCRQQIQPSYIDHGGVGWRMAYVHQLMNASGTDNRAYRLVEELMDLRYTLSLAPPVSCCEFCGQTLDACGCDDSDMADHVCPICVHSGTPCITEATCPADADHDYQEDQ